jgi:hypothetical protein
VRAICMNDVKRGCIGLVDRIGWISPRHRIVWVGICELRSVGFRKRQAM